MKQRICNLNSFSAVLDRIIIEQLKLIRFLDACETEKIESQEKILDGLREELQKIFEELENGDYLASDEHRTYDSKANQLIDDIFKLCICNYVIGKNDKRKVVSAESKRVKPKQMRNYILQVRDYLEFRAHIKNRLERTIR